MSESSISSRFPPRLIVGARVWTTQGYHDHGPRDGPTVNIAPHMGGIIESVSKPFYTMDHLLYAVRWDDGQTSKHYEKDLFCIGRFKTFDEYRAAITPHEPVNLTLGPQGGFREARFSVTYDGEMQESHLLQGDRQLWITCVEPIIRERSMKVVETRVPSARKGKGIS